MDILELVGKVDFVELVSQRTSLKKISEHKYKGLSPFTNEKTPSFNLDSNANVWFCYSYGKGGGVLDYIQLAENLSRADAIKFLKEYLGEEDVEEDIVSKALRLALGFFAQGKDEAKSYMVGRGFSEDIVDTYELGHIGSGEALLTYLTRNDIPDDKMVEAGLATVGKNGDTRPFYSNRLMIPIRDVYGKLVSFTGRDTSGKSKVKYLHGTSFQKRNTVWNLNKVRKMVGEFIIVCEGQMDAMALTEAGFPAVAVLGSSISPEQLQMLAKVAAQIYITYDNDEAGERGLVKAFEMARDTGIDSVVYSLVVPEGDPDEYIHTNGPEKFSELLLSAKSDTSAIVHALIKEHQASGINYSKVSIAKKVIGALKPTMQHRLSYRSLDLVERISQEFSLPQSEVQKHLSVPFKGLPNAVIEEVFPAPIYERRVLLGILNEPSLMNTLRENDLYVSDFNSFLVSKILNLVKPEYDSVELFDELKDKLPEDEYYKILEFFSVGVSMIDFHTALQVMKNKVELRAKGDDKRFKSFIGRPLTSGEIDSKAVLKEIMGYS